MFLQGENIYFKTLKIIILLLSFIAINSTEIDKDYQESNINKIEYITQSNVQADEVKETHIAYLSKTDYLNSIIELPSNYNNSEVQNMINRINLFDEKIIKNLYKKGAKIRLVNSAITNESEVATLKGIVPRGWENTGYTWDNVPGIAYSTLAIVRIGYSFPSLANMHNTMILEMHELSHVIDYSVFNYISSSAEFKQIHALEKNNLFNNSYMDYSEEYFAEVLSMYFYNNETNNTLKNNAPLTYEFITKAINSLN